MKRIIYIVVVGTAVILGFQALRYAHYEGVKTAVGQR